MRIAVDLDGVIFDTERDFRVLCEIYDIDNHKQNKVINNSFLKFQDRYFYLPFAKNTSSGYYI